MKFKVGDKVRVRNDLVANVEYGPLYCIREMENYVGKDFEIVDVGVRPNGDVEYRIDDGDLWWSDEMLEPVGEEWTEIMFGPVEEKKQEVEEEEEEAITTKAILQDCPFCKTNSRGSDLCNTCKGLKKVWFLCLTDDYNVFTLRTLKNEM